MNKHLEKWKKKSLFSKITDLLFVILVVAMIIPVSGKEIMAFVNGIKAKVISPKVYEQAISKLSDDDYKWQIADLNGNVHYLNEFKGKVIFINFWATWCGPCIGEMPEIQKLYVKYKDNDEVVFIIASTDDLNKIKTFAQKRDFTLPFYTIAGNLPDKLEYSSIPTTFLINKNGEIMLHQTGAANWSGNKMKNFIDNFINQK